MEQTPWYRWWSTVGGASLLLPPVGLALLWTRPGTRLLTKLVLSVPVALLGAVYAMSWLGLTVERDGTGWRPSFTRPTAETHYATLERNRAEHLERIPGVPEAPRRTATPGDRAPGPAATTPATIDAPVPRIVPEPAAPPFEGGRSAYWTDFRGPHRDGRYDQTDVLVTWPATGPRMLWRQPVGGGYASFVVAEGRAFTIEQRRQQEVVASYEVETGRELWTHGWDAAFRESMGGDGPRATPTWHEGRLYALGAAGELRCLDAKTGALLWRHDILSSAGASNLRWAMSAAPLIVDDKVVVLPGGGSGKSVVAYDRLSGELVWQVLDDRQAYTSPMLVTLAGVRQILIVSAQRAMGLAVEDGALLWGYPWTTQSDINVAQPVVLDEHRVFLSAGYGHGAAVFEVRRAGDRYTTETIWQNNRMKNKFTSSVLHEGYLYGLDESILACVDARTGELQWKGGRYGYGQVVLAGDRLIVLTEGGDLVLVRATPSAHEELARFSALEGKTWNHPAISDGRLLVRNATQMAGFDISRR